MGMAFDFSDCRSESKFNRFFGWFVGGEPADSIYPRRPNRAIDFADTWLDGVSAADQDHRNRFNWSHWIPGKTGNWPSNCKAHHVCDTRNNDTKVCQAVSESVRQWARERGDWVGSN